MRITAKALLPLNIGLLRGTDNYLHTLDYITGTSLRGAMAQGYLREGGRAEDEIFQEIFLQERVFFPNLYPSKPLAQPDKGPTWREVRVMPFTARSCKRHKGFDYHREDEKWQEKKHGVVDILFPLALAKINQDLGMSKDVEYCLKCAATMDRFPGFYQRQDYGRAYDSIQAAIRTITRTAINRKTGRAMDKMLYSLEAINEDECFTGQVFIPNNLTLPAHEMLHNMLNCGQILRIGRSKTRGLGKIHILEDHTSNNLSPTVKERFQDFNHHLKAYAKKLKKPLRETDLFFSITLQSDLILIDPFLRYLRELTEEVLALEGIFAQDEIEKVCQIIDTRVVHGWNGAAQLPKEDEWAIAKGSLFLFKFKNSKELNEEKMSRITERLSRLETYGLGLRRGEGFGRVYICDPFHWEVR